MKKKIKLQSSIYYVELKLLGTNFIKLFQLNSYRNTQSASCTMSDIFYILMCYTHSCLEMNFFYTSLIGYLTRLLFQFVYPCDVKRSDLTPFFSLTFSLLIHSCSSVCEQNAVVIDSIHIEFNKKLDIEILQYAVGQYVPYSEIVFFFLLCRRLYVIKGESVCNLFSTCFFFVYLNEALMKYFYSKLFQFENVYFML